MDINVKLNPLVKRIFFCSSFELYYLFNIESGVIDYFSFYFVGSHFVRELIVNFAEKVKGLDSGKLEETKRVIIEEVKQHKYLTELDKKRSIKLFEGITL